jgi:hypothetical protein
LKLAGAAREVASTLVWVVVVRTGSEAADQEVDAWRVLVVIGAA